MDMTPSIARNLAIFPYKSIRAASCVADNQALGKGAKLGQYRRIVLPGFAGRGTC
jgi:hypothetical protein